MRAIRNGRGSYGLDRDPPSGVEPPSDPSKWLICEECECRYWLPLYQQAYRPRGCPNCNAGEHWLAFDWWVLSSYFWDDQEAAERFRTRCREAGQA